YSNYDPQTQFPRTIVQDATGEERVTNLDFDDWGHLSLVQRSTWGMTETWDYDERTRLHQYGIAGDEGSFESVFSYLDNGLVESVTDGEGVTRFTYDPGREQRTIRRTAGNDEQLTCLFFRPDGALEASVDPLGA